MTFYIIGLIVLFLFGVVPILWGLTGSTWQSHQGLHEDFYMDMRDALRKRKTREKGETIRGEAQKKQLEDRIRYLRQAAKYGTEPIKSNARRRLAELEEN